MNFKPRYEGKFPPIKLSRKGKTPKKRSFLFLIITLMGMGCGSPAEKFATETLRIDSLKQQLTTMRVWVMVDEKTIESRYSHLQQQDSLIQLPGIARHLPPELELSMTQFRVIPGIYQTYLQLFTQQRRQLDSLAKNTDSIRDLLYNEKIGRKKFRELFDGQQQFCNNLQTQMEATAKKVIEVEPTYRRIQPHIDSLEKFWLRPVR